MAPGRSNPPIRGRASGTATVPPFESIVRIFTSTIGGVRVRAKLAVHFAETPGARDSKPPADMAEGLARAALGECTSPEAAMDRSAAIAEQVLRALPRSARVSRVELVVAPLEGFTTPQSRRPSLTSARGERGRVLLVDDDPECRSTLAVLMQDEFEVVEAAGPTIARAEVSGRCGRFDVVLTDYEMPDGDGVALLTSLAEEHPHLIGILVTAHEKYAQAAAARQDGAFFRILLKPYDPEVLLSTVRGAVSLARMRTSTARLGPATR